MATRWRIVAEFTDSRPGQAAALAQGMRQALQSLMDSTAELSDTKVTLVEVADDDPTPISLETES